MARTAAFFVSASNEAGHTVKIYDMEKTICDCVRYRNKIGIDTVKECINEYLKRKDKDLNKLIKYV